MATNNNNGVAVRKGAWTKEEDILLRDCIHKFGEGKWHLVPLRAGLNRCRKSCRLRWLNYLRPNLNRGFFSKDEVDLIVRLHKLLGNRWSLIAGRLPGRTANDVKNFWNTHISKKSGATGENRRGKIITESNIVRPRPRTFSNAQPPAWSSELTRSNSSASSAAKPPADDVGSSKSRELSSSPPFYPTVDGRPVEDDLDECLRWWGDLLEMTENGEQTPFLFADELPRGTEAVFPVGFGSDDGSINSADGEGLCGNLTLDGEDMVWSLNN